MELALKVKSDRLHRVKVFKTHCSKLVKQKSHVLMRQRLIIKASPEGASVLNQSNQQGLPEEE